MSDVRPVSLSIAELADGGERDLGATEWFRITQSRVDGFADATEDHQWIHVDAERAAAGPYGATIAHGYLTLSLVPFLLEQILTVSDQVTGTNYGIDRVRFTHAVPVGSEIRLAGSVVDAVLNPEKATVRYRVAVGIEIRGVEKPAMVGELIYLASNAAPKT